MLPPFEKEIAQTAETQTKTTGKQQEKERRRKSVGRPRRSRRLQEDYGEDFRGRRTTTEVQMRFSSSGKRIWAREGYGKTTRSLPKRRRKRKGRGRGPEGYGKNGKTLPRTNSNQNTLRWKVVQLKQNGLCSKARRAKSEPPTEIQLPKIGGTGQPLNPASRR